MILLDTPGVVWLALDPNGISHEARAATDQAHKEGEGLALCHITFLQLTALVSKGRGHFDISLETCLREVEARFAP